MAGKILWNKNIIKKLVFISHIIEEKEIAILVKNFIEKAFLGLIEVFVASDQDSISLGQKWLNNITAALSNCSIEIISCSPESIKRPWINFEAGAGWIKDIPVIPLCHSGLQPSSLPLPLNLLQAATANEISSLNLLLPVLSKAIDANTPTYDFTDFVQKVKNFENIYTFWNECNKIFNQINDFNNQIITGLKNGKNITIDLTEIEMKFFQSLMPFLNKHQLLSFEKLGNAFLRSSGTYYNCRIILLSGFEKIKDDPKFLFK